MAVQRLRTTQEKKSSMAKQSRREIATLLERGKLETARIKVENIINEDIYLELLELLELYCELLIARFGLLELPSKDPDPGISEGVAAIVHATPRTEVKELHVLRDMLMAKFGREYAVRVMENQGNCVSDRVIRKLVVEMPSNKLVDAYLREIAKGYQVDWKPDNGNGGDGGGGLKETIPDRDLEELEGIRSEKAAIGEFENRTVEGESASAERSSAETAKSTEEEDAFTKLSKRFEALKSR